MSLHVSRSLLLAATFLGPVAAQQGDDCPREMAVAQPASVTNGPPGPCTGIEYQIAGVTVTTKAVACPTFAVFIPPHDQAGPSKNRTMVEETGQVPITMITFRCERSYFVFIPLGLECVVTGTQNAGTVRQLKTVPCAPQA
ncbi:MAG: hypothetical protein ACK501_00500 [Planctomycetota bacterium]|jgi:hypothetical protein